MSWFSRILEYAQLRKSGHVHALPMRQLLTNILTGRIGYSFIKGKHIEFCQRSEAGWSNYYTETNDKDPESKNYFWFDLHFSITRALASISISYRNEPLNVIDVGGGRGDVFFACKQLCPKIKFNKWIVVEDEKVVREAPSNLADDTIEFHDDIHSVPQELEIDLVFCSGTLFYPPNPYELFSGITQLNPRYISLPRTAMTEKDYDVFGIQELPNGTNVPLYIFQKFKLIEMAKPSYNLQFECLEALGAIRISDEPIHMFWLLFNRK